MALERLDRRFVEAVLSWIDNTSKNREDKEASLRSFIGEAGGLSSKTYPRLYRGQPIDDEQMEALKAGESIVLPIQGLRSWTTKRQIAVEWAETGGYYPAVCIARSGMSGFLDIRNFVSRCKNLGFPVNDWDDALRYGAREGEVIVDHPEPLVVSPEDILAYYGDEFEDGPILMKTL